MGKRQQEVRAGLVNADAFYLARLTDSYTPSKTGNR
jgi:hypothetical protein